MSKPPRIVTPETSIDRALKQMSGERLSALFVAAGTPERLPPAAASGIVTERDLMRTLAEHGERAFRMPIGGIASRPLSTVPSDALVYRALGRMNRLNVRHLGVVDEDGRLCGSLSSRDLLHLRAEAAVVIGDEIEQAEDVPELARAFGKLPRVASGLLAEGVPGREIAALISHELAALTRRAAQLAENRMKTEGEGDPPCAYAFAVLGSAGRGESLLALDQDNALVFAEGAVGGAHDRWFERLAGIANDILHQVGVPYCKGGVMARNRQWRGSMATWRERIEGWIQHARPEDLLSVDIFFDMRSVHGEAALANGVWRAGFGAARGQIGFARLLAEANASGASPFNFFGRLRTEQGRIDLKRFGLFGIVSAARLLAIRHHVLERSTPARLSGIAALGLGGAFDLAALDEAHGIFIDLILDQQIADIEHGLPAGNAVALKRLSPRDHNRMRAALDATRHLDDITRDLLFKD